MNKQGIANPFGAQSTTAEVIAGIANSVANPKEYLGPYGRVTNTWKAKIAC